MTDLSIYKGEDFALIIEAFADDGTTHEDISDYDIVAQLSTTPLGNKIIASTQNLKGSIPIIRRGNSIFAINISAQLTATLSAGAATLSFVVTHKQTKSQIISAFEVFEVKQSELNPSLI